MNDSNISETTAKCVVCLRDTDQILSKNRIYLTKISDIYLEYLKPNFTTTFNSVPFDWEVLENTDDFFSSKFCMECFTSGQKLLSMNNRLKSIELEIENFVQTISTKILKHRSRHSNSYTRSPSSTDTVLPVSPGNISSNKVDKRWTQPRTTRIGKVDIKKEISDDHEGNFTVSSHSNVNDNSLDDVDCFNEYNSELDNDRDNIASASDIEEINFSNNANGALSLKPIVLLERLKPDFSNRIDVTQPGPSHSVVGRKRKKINYASFFKKEKGDNGDGDESPNIYDSDCEPDTKLFKGTKKGANGSQEIYECLNCDQTFAVRKKYMNHIETAHKDCPNYCRKCNKSFGNKKSLRLHIDFVHRLKPKACAECPELPAFVNIYDYEIHHMSHTGEMPYECQQCHEKFSNSTTYCDHQKYCSSNSEVFSCELCDNVFTANCFLLCHMNAAHFKTRKDNGGMPSCHICEDHPKFKDFIFLETHFATEHTNEFMYLCDICGCSVQSNRILKLHRRSHLAGANLNICQFCGYCNRSHIHLQDHIKLHHTHEEVSHSCEKCGKTFSIFKKLRTHAYSCGGVHTCDICGKFFINIKSFKDHFKSHLEGKPTCKECGKEFETSSGLRSHMNVIHLQKNEFMCDTCGKTFNRKDSYVQHMRNHTEGTSRQCKICGEVLGSTYKLKEHKRLVHYELTIVCKFCPMTFPTHDRRRLHINREHSETINEDKYKCTTCGMGFQTFLLRDKHRTSEHGLGKKISVCKFCLMTFPSHGRRRLHIHKEHPETISEDQYKCTTCGMGFQTVSLRDKHRLSEHGLGKRIRKRKSKIVQ